LEKVAPPSCKPVDALVAPSLIHGMELGIKAREKSFTEILKFFGGF
jgi:hypothetical protein